MSGETHNVFRDEKVHVLAAMCKTCVFRPGNLMQLKSGRLRGMVNDANEHQSAIVCHATLYRDDVEGHAVCRGYYDRHKEDNVTLKLATVMEVIEWQGPPE